VRDYLRMGLDRCAVVIPIGIVPAYGGTSSTIAANGQAGRHLPCGWPTGSNMMRARSAAESIMLPKMAEPPGAIRPSSKRLRAQWPSMSSLDAPKPSMS
jgi:hypothetical protein